MPYRYFEPSNALPKYEVEFSRVAMLAAEPFHGATPDSKDGFWRTLQAETDILAGGF